MRWGALIALAGAAAWAGPALAQPLALTGGTVYLPDGPREGVTILVDGGRIVAVGEGIAVPEGAAVIDATGQVVTPGLVAPLTELGVLEVGLEAGTVDSRPDGDAPIHASLRVTDAYNPRSSLIPVARAHGVTSAISAPPFGLIAGQGGWVDLVGGSQAAAIVDPSVAMFASFAGGEGSRAMQLNQLREALEDARIWASRRDAWERGDSRAFSLGRQDLEALGPVVRGEEPLVVAVDRAADIEALLRLSDELGISLIVAGGAEAHLIADRLAARHVPVILDPFIVSPGTFDQLSAREDNAALLSAAGVPVIIAGIEGGDNHRLGRTRQLAGNAVRGGMDHTAAIQAITQTPADAFGMEGYGRIQAGAVANLVVWSGDPLELTEGPVRVFIHGEELPRVSRHTRLLERYRQLPGTPLAPLPLP